MKIRLMILALGVCFGAGSARAAEFYQGKQKTTFWIKAANNDPCFLSIDRSNGMEFYKFLLSTGERNPYKGPYMESTFGFRKEMQSYIAVDQYPLTGVTGSLKHSGQKVEMSVKGIWHERQHQTKVLQNARIYLHSGIPSSFVYSGTLQTLFFLNFKVKCTDLKRVINAPF